MGGGGGAKLPEFSKGMKGAVTSGSAVWREGGPGAVGKRVQMKIQRGGNQGEASPPFWGGGGGGG